MPLYEASSSSSADQKKKNQTITKDEARNAVGPASDSLQEGRGDHRREEDRDISKTEEESGFSRSSPSSASGSSNPGPSSPGLSMTSPSGSSSPAAAAAGGASSPISAPGPIRRQSSLPKFPVANHARMQAFATTSPGTYTSSSFARSSSVPDTTSATAAAAASNLGTSGLGAIPKNRDKQIETRKKQLETLKVRFFSYYEPKILQ